MVQKYKCPKCEKNYGEIDMGELMFDAVTSERNLVRVKLLGSLWMKLFCPTCLVELVPDPINRFPDPGYPDPDTRPDNDGSVE